MTDEKTCPQCAETVKAGAKVCRFCGYNFETSTPAGTVVHPVPPKAERPLWQTLGCVALIVIVLAAALSMCSSDSTNSATATVDGAAPSETSVEPAMKVTATELFRAYEANEAAAQEKYGNRALEVTATLGSVDLDFADKPTLMLNTPNQFMSAQASLTEASQAKASSLSKGQKLVLLCSGVSEVIGTPMLKDCEIQ